MSKVVSMEMHRKTGNESRVTRFTMYPVPSHQVQVEIDSQGSTGVYRVYLYGNPKPLLTGSADEPMQVVLDKIREAVQTL